ncbi:uncharacterized protein LOC114075354 [Solanum pennellii]|uniref:Uncharacterized protein LOC114075354 n=1 Tax=Solanum pennellii TaxID=28526 RepID=A0ABM1V1K3_SOLPN|nr:uncharacterized protein LOC114075354 [Solanum pennellii]
MKCSVCKTFGHNKTGCPTLKNVGAGTSDASVGTSNVATRTPCAGTSEGPRDVPCAGPSTGLRAVPRAGPSAGQREVPCADPSVGSRAVSSEGPREVPCSDPSAGPRAVLCEGPREVLCAGPRAVPSFTQQSTSSATGQKRKTSTTLRGSASLDYKKPRQKQAKTTERSENTDRVLHSATLTCSTPTNIDLGYKPKGLRWKGRAAITQRQLREESYRSTQGTPSTQVTQGTH